MVDVSPHTPLSINPTSALALFTKVQARKGSTSPGPVSLRLPRTGVSQSSLGSLIWIDTAFAQALATNDFLSAINSGDIPPALDSRCEHAVNSKLFYQSPERLMERPVTLIEALGLTDHITALATQSLALECPRCGIISKRHPSPQQVLPAIQEQMTEPVVLFAEGEQQALTAWASSHGIPFQVEQFDQASPRARVKIDSFKNSGDSSARLSRIIHSLWRLRAPALVCVRETATHIFSKQGNCASCGHVFQPAGRTDISRALRTNGFMPGWEDNLGVFVLPHGKSVRAILNEPLDTLISLPSLSNSQSLSLILRTPLSEKALGTCTNTLTAREIASLVTCRSLGDTLYARGTCVLDIPEPVLRDAPCYSLSTIISEKATQTGVILITSRETPPTTLSLEPRDAKSGEIIGTLHVRTSNGPTRVYPVKQGQDISLTDSSLYQIEASLLSKSPEVSSVSFIAESAYEVSSIPVFFSERRATSLLVHRLGLADSFATLLASSVDARTAGLTARDFALSTSGKSNKNLCQCCNGLGTLLEHVDELPRPLARACVMCDGGRFVGKLANMSWRGVPLPELLNSPLREVLHLVRALPRAAEIIQCVEALGLTHLPLGMPIALMSRSEQHALRWAHALLTATRAKPAVVLAENALVSLTAIQRTGLRGLLESFPRAKHLSVVLLLT